jgi:hypothetical protein
VFCPNASLEEIAGALPRNLDELRALAALKPWWAEQFGAEVLAVLHDAEVRSPADDAPRNGNANGNDGPEDGTDAAADPAQPRRKRSRRGRRGSRGGRRRR